MADIRIHREHQLGLTKARKAKRFERVLECQIPEEVYEAMEKELQDDA